VAKHLTDQLHRDALGGQVADQPAVSSFWEAARGEVGRGAAQDFVLHLQPPHLAAQLHELVLLGAGLAIDEPSSMSVWRTQRRTDST
jgi:hypothetical protein